MNPLKLCVCYRLRHSATHLEVPKDLRDLGLPGWLLVAKWTRPAAPMDRSEYAELFVYSTQKEVSHLTT